MPETSTCFSPPEYCASDSNKNGTALKMHSFSRRSESLCQLLDPAGPGQDVEFDDEQPDEQVFGPPQSFAAGPCSPQAEDRNLCLTDRVLPVIQRYFGANPG